MKKLLDANQTSQLVASLAKRFEQNLLRHKAVQWSEVLEKLEAQPQKLVSLWLMDERGGEPDIIGIDPSSQSLAFYDCAAESPKERRSLCYDEAALASRKENKPKGSAIGMATEMGITLLNETQYRHLQQLQAVDLKTSSWLLAPTNIRKLGGAIFGDNRFETIFIYHNGAESYYGSRGFRGCLTL